MSKNAEKKKEKELNVSLCLLAGGVAEAEEKPLRRTRKMNAKTTQFLHIVGFFVSQLM